MPGPDQMKEQNPHDFFKRGGVIDDSPQEFLGGFKIGERSLDNEKVQELIDRVESLENLIKTTFDGHVLIDGQWRKITVQGVVI